MPVPKRNSYMVCSPLQTSTFIPSNVVGICWLLFTRSEKVNPLTLTNRSAFCSGEFDHTAKLMNIAKHTSIPLIMMNLFFFITFTFSHSNLLAANSIFCCLRTASTQGIDAQASQGSVAPLTEQSDETFSVWQFFLLTENEAPQDAHTPDRRV